MGNFIHKNTGLVLTTDWNSHKESCSTEESVFTNSSLTSRNVTASKREIQSSIKILHVSNRKHQKNATEDNKSRMFKQCKYLCLPNFIQNIQKSHLLLGFVFTFSNKKRSNGSLISEIIQRSSCFDWTRDSPVSRCGTRFAEGLFKKCHQKSSWWTETFKAFLPQHQGFSPQDLRQPTSSS